MRPPRSWKSSTPRTSENSWVLKRIPGLFISLENSRTETIFFYLVDKFLVSAGAACSRRPSARTMWRTVGSFGLPSGDSALYRLSRPRLSLFTDHFAIPPAARAMSPGQRRSAQGSPSSDTASNYAAMFLFSDDLPRPIFSLVFAMITLPTGPAPVQGPSQYPVPVSSFPLRQEG